MKWSRRLTLCQQVALKAFLGLRCKQSSAALMNINMHYTEARWKKNIYTFLKTVILFFKNEYRRRVEIISNRWRCHQARKLLTITLLALRSERLWLTATKQHSLEFKQTRLYHYSSKCGTWMRRSKVQLNCSTSEKGTPLLTCNDSFLFESLKVSFQGLQQQELFISVLGF